MDEMFDTLYKSDTKISLLVLIFSLIAIFISALGLFGLAAFTAERRTKEIGIRKVLGASINNIISLIAQEFLWMVFLSIIIATPIAWIFMSKWLQNFAYRVSLNWWIFGLAGMTALLIALATVSIQAIKAALMNPVKSLRTE